MGSPSCLLCSILLATSVIFGHVSAQQNPEDKACSKDHCFTPNCIKTAATYLQMMNQTHDPCQDFYEFACGNFLHEAIIPDDQYKVGSIKYQSDKLNARLRNILEADSKDNEPAVFSSVRKLYASCMDLDLLDKEGSRMILQVIEDLGGWPVLQGEYWDPDKFDWQKVAGKASQLGLGRSCIVSVNIHASHNSSSQLMIQIGMPFELILSKDLLSKGFYDPTVQAYLRYMIDTAVYLGADESEAEQDLQQVLKFEMDLVEMVPSDDELRNLSIWNNQMTILEASKLYPDFHLLDHIKQIIGSGIMINESEIVNVSLLEYFTALRDFLPTVSKRVIANYVIWNNVAQMIEYSGHEALNIISKFMKQKLGSQAVSPRWKTCVKQVTGIIRQKGSLSHAVGSMYVREYFSQEERNVATEMVDNIKREFKFLMSKTEWMDILTWERAQEKIDNMRMFVAYENEVLNNSDIDLYYEGLQLSSESLLMNVLNLKKFMYSFTTREFRNPRKTWKGQGGGVAVVNAFYNAPNNLVVIPAGILDGIFFQADLPAYLNYGAIGSIIGHELTHGFDDTGSQVDGKGNLVDWWEEETKDMYLERVQCIIDQYSNYTVNVNGELLPVNEIRTQGENIADNGGLRVARKAYERLASKSNMEQRLPGLDYTPQQLFWLAGAVLNCGKYRPEALKNAVLNDLHSPKRVRVNAVLGNIAEFAQDWNCKVGTPMNPADKCIVW